MGRETQGRGRQTVTDSITSYYIMKFLLEDLLDELEHRSVICKTK